MIFWIIVGIVGLGLYFLNQNKTEKKDRTTITHKRVIQTKDGEVHINQTQVIDSVRTTYKARPDLSEKVIRDVVPAISHTQSPQEKPMVQEIKSESLIISDKQPHRFSHQSPLSEIEEIKSEPLTLTSPQSDTQQDLFSINNESKECSNCKRNLQFNSFFKSNKYTDGLTKWCIECLNNHQSRLPRNKKQCPKCRKVRLKSSFYKNKNTEDGLTKWCKTCMDKSRG